MIIGITGTMGAGKDTIADYLVDKWGFRHHSCSDVLRDELFKTGRPESRENLRNLGNRLRSSFGLGVLGRRILQKIVKDKEDKVVVTAIRHPDEIKALREGRNFYLMSIDAETNLRFERLRQRDRKGDSVTREDFEQQEDKEMGTEEAGPQVGACMTQADYKILNNGSFKDLHREIKRVLKEIGVG